MTGRETLRNGAGRLYEENVTPGNSPAFDWIAPIGMSILKKILSGIGAFIDNHTGFLNPYITPEKEGQPGYKPQASPAMASGYRMAMAGQAVPLSMYRSKAISPGYRTMRCTA